MLALIDGDIIIYRVGFTTQEEDENIALWRCDEMMENIYKAVSATHCQVWLSDSTENNFRTKFYPEYKANRKDFVKPKHYNFLREYLVKCWNAQIAIEQEADDCLGIEQSKLHGRGDTWETVWNEETAICSIDKDLLQIAGNHYNFVTGEYRYVTPEQGLKFFYTQLLTGDTSDNIQGCPGIGAAKAAKALAGCVSEESLFHAVCNVYEQSYSKKIFKHDPLSETELQFVKNQILIGGICLKIRTQEGEIWTFPKDGLESISMEQLPTKLNELTPTN